MIDKNGEEIIKNISYRLQFIDSGRFMENPLLNLVDNLSEGIHKIKCKYGHDDKKCETCGIKYKYCDIFVEYTNFEDDLQIMNKWIIGKSSMKHHYLKMKIFTVT